MSGLNGWENFYVIVGSSAGALIGLQFVVITLIAEMPMVKDVAGGSSTFATPTITHFGAVLLLSAVVSAPWHRTAAAAILWGAVGVAGLAYVVVVAQRMRVQTAYSPVFEDQLFHVLLPFAAYATLAASAYAARANLASSLYAVGAAALVLLLVGIHNAWDAVTYHVIAAKRKEQQAPPPR